MAEATLGQIDQRITEIDDLVFRGNTGQLPMTVEGRARLEDEAGSLMEILARALHENGAGEYQTLYDARQQVRNLTLVSAMSHRYMELHPEPQPEIDAVIAAACQGYTDGTGPKGQAGKMLAAVFGTVLIELPSEVPPPSTKRNFFSRFMRR
ncbi:hypothetical protein RBB77_23305 (plasmid) [Tunturibacter psychrotolerans]|uniref:LysR family transcriptional regulator n=1 Tax=Tunturiibacter psychrotolerans TaxID=3069686 RepID=A0AAU7ZXG9_9BACT